MKRSNVQPANVITSLYSDHNQREIETPNLTLKGVLISHKAHIWNILTKEISQMSRNICGIWLKVVFQNISQISTMECRPINKKTKEKKNIPQASNLCFFSTVVLH